MNTNVIPTLLIAYVEAFRKAFNKPGYTYFIGFIWALMLIPGRKRVTDIANACFFIDKHVSSFERFLSENKWSMNGVIASLVSLLLSHLGERLMVHGAYLCAEDATFARAKRAKRCRACRSGRTTAAILTVVAIYSDITGQFSDCSLHSEVGGFVFPYWQG